MEKGCVEGDAVLILCTKYTKVGGEGGACPEAWLHKFVHKADKGRRGRGHGFMSLCTKQTTSLGELYVR